MSKGVMNQAEAPLLDALLEFGNSNPAYFRIPAHRFEEGVNPRLLKAFGKGVFRCDLSEAEGLDDLHQAGGVIQKAQKLAAQLWGARETFFLVNGTTCGNEAMMLSTAGPGDKVLVPRNAHKSILMGLIMSGAEPCYVMPCYDQRWNLWGSVAPGAVREKLEQEGRGCKAVFLVSPTYYGVCSDLKTIGEICHTHEAVLCVDEAHGSHLYFSEHLPKGALQQGADLCAQSIHKTTGSMTQSSLLQIGSNRVDRDLVASNLQMVQSTSPSYVLMASLDGARQELALHGESMMERALELADTARKRLREISGIQVLDREDYKDQAVYDLDPLRLTFSARELGISGYRMQELLFRRSGISTELADEENLVCVITFGNTEQDVGRLVTAVRAIAGDQMLHGKREAYGNWDFSLPDKVLNPREAYFHKKISVDWEGAVGKVAGEMLVPYPPGIPLVYPGELISREIWQQVEDCRIRGLSIHGPSDPGLNKIQIIL
ncbi:aminotransferase class I/II-fold pyridoxal phosphate-dependent enzyme [Novisyntrophococcus fermenticellae]|uniref:aminotransferase class I/II-fold pyridoxal phosphate-dependent enzyme n=1 Tax=Novisyntrophococcus fermenticellae TaxID=2068655 RepID=UPI001E3F3A73|nr:aminotransferase class I/II-fold pyridoxal phosphate-dependent enzyme [Novisyntrophococcus fermenticellae]